MNNTGSLKKYITFICFYTALVIGNLIVAASGSTLKLPWKAWEGVPQNQPDQNEIVLKTPALTSYVFTHPSDWRDYDAVAFDLELPDNQIYDIQLNVAFDFTAHYNTQGSEFIVFPQEARAVAKLSGKGRHHVAMPISHFDVERIQPGMWQFVKRLELSIKTKAEGAGTSVSIREICIVRHAIIHLSCPDKSMPGPIGEKVVYPLTIENLSDNDQLVTLSFQSTGEEMMPVEIEPAVLQLQPGQTAACNISVKVTDDIAIGGFEIQRIIAVPNADGFRAQSLELKTVRCKPHPYILLDEPGWQRVHYKMSHFPWARQAGDRVIQRAKAWQVPDFSRADNVVFNKGWGSMVALIDVAVAWKISQDPDFKNKIITTLRRLSDPQNGYLVKRNACSSGGIGIHEGMVFTYFCMAYDLVYDEPELTQADHHRLRAVLADFIDRTAEFLTGRLIYNYSTGPNAGAILAALMIQDMERLNNQLYGPGGLSYQIGNGVQADGWHLEGATNYHILILRYYVNVAAACSNWGINLYDAQFPANYARQTQQGTAYEGYLGMTFQKWGPPGKNTRSLRDMFDGTIGLMDYRGVVVANNDSRRHEVYDVYEQAYAHYLDPAYAWVARQGNRSGYRSDDDLGNTAWRHLLFGVPELPEVPDPRSHSTNAENVGLTALRSQKADQTPDEQILAVMKWGSHGGWHGHFDRTGLLALQRYGKDFYYPIYGFTAYERDQYKMWDQASASHNMVVVDEGNQEPVECDLLLMHSGQMFQACAVQTRARWTDVPDWMKFYPLKYGPDLYDTGVYYDQQDSPVLQRRLLLVLEDYVVMADYLDSESEHTFDWLLHPVGFRQLQAKSQTFLYHDAQAGTENVSSYKYFTNCDWYDIEAPLLNQFQDGILKLNIYNVWPHKFTFMLGDFPSHRDPEIAASETRKTLVARTQGRQVVYLTVIEPFKDQALIKQVSAPTAKTLHLELMDGREHIITLNNFQGDGDNIKVHIDEFKEGQKIRSEITKQ